MFRLLEAYRDGAKLGTNNSMIRSDEGLMARCSARAARGDAQAREELSDYTARFGNDHAKMTEFAKDVEKKNYGLLERMAMGVGYAMNTFSDDSDFF